MLELILPLVLLMIYGAVPLIYVGTYEREDYDTHP